jgi:hypothetical protein
MKREILNQCHWRVPEIQQTSRVSRFFVFWEITDG